MKTRTVHRTNFGCYAPATADIDGYITYHDSPRYARLPLEALHELAESSRFGAVRSAAKVELASRAISRWRETGEN